MSEEKISITEIPSIEKYSRVYSGKPGCMCGCNGKYYPGNSKDAPTAKDKTMFKKIKKIFEENLPNVYTYPDTVGKIIRLDFSPKRHYVIYF
jgi:hypothetical protein